MRLGLGTSLSKVRSGQKVSLRSTDTLSTIQVPSGPSIDFEYLKTDTGQDFMRAFSNMPVVQL